MILHSSCSNGTFYDTHLTVNDPACAVSLYSENTLYYSFQAPDPVSNARPKIKITASVGEASGNMFSSTGTTYGTMTCPCFDFRGISRNGNLLSYTLTLSEDKLAPADNASLTLEWSGIISTASEGICSVTVEISGFGNELDGKNTCYLYKSLAATEICYFTASPASACPGEPVTLEWKVINVNAGYILPGGYNIFAGGVQSSSSCVVPMPFDSNSFFLYASGSSQSVYKEVKVFTPSPVINLLLEGRSASWECHYASRYELAENGVYSKIEPADSRILRDDTTSIAIRCTGDPVSEEEIRLVLPGTNITFNKYIHGYSNHKVIGISWKIPDGRMAVVKIWDTACYTVSSLPEGNWEYAYDSKINVTAELIIDPGTPQSLDFRL